jgi:hypothetical protein
MEKQVSERSTKKDLWDAYQELIRGKTEDATEEAKTVAGEGVVDIATGGAVLEAPVQAHTVSAAPVLRELDALRHRMSDTLDRFGDQAASFEKRAEEEEEKLAREM